MTDLERARALMRNSPPTLAKITEALAAARREGAERAAEEMRERAEIALLSHPGLTLDEKCIAADVIRALPLTLEEPKDYATRLTQEDH